MSTLVVIPAYQAHRHLGKVLSELQQRAKAQVSRLFLLVVDDGSTDLTEEVAAAAGVSVLRHSNNLGKGAALRTGLNWAKANGFTQVVTADADGQHPADEILRLVNQPAPPHALLLGIRNLWRDGAPSANRFSNGLSNRFLSLFTGLRLLDTQCGLRRYPVKETLALKCQDPGYAFEAEVILRAARAGLPILQLPIVVHYPEKAERLSHFHVVRDPYRIVCRVVATLLE
jgi:glycosyltransferase involved in cell wall biosynthesis